MSSKIPHSTTPSSRILALDYLRGFFIVIIIVDHLWRWPNIFAAISGRGELWASAAEGFVIISGLLVGYVRGYKSRNKPLKDISKKLISRGVLLYIWMIITSLAIVAASWALSFRGNIAYIPIPENDWQLLITSVLRFDYVHTLTHFLYLYAIFLVLSPLAIWLLRHRLAWIVAGISILGWTIGTFQGIEWLQWQIIFFVPVVAGYYFDAILTWFRTRPPMLKRFIRISTIACTFITIGIAAATILPMSPGVYESTLFSRDPITLPTIATAFLWFAGLLSLFQYLMPILKRTVGWLLLTFGERSLTAYILHTIPLIICQLLFIETNNIWINSLLAAGCILSTWALLKIPHINRIIPR